MNIRPLAPALEDQVEDVRVTAAHALGAMGSAARDAVAPLVARLAVKDETRSALIAAVGALGNIGADARSALPALQEAARSRQLGAAPQEAVLKIQGKRVPTWW